MKTNQTRTVRWAGLRSYDPDDPTAAYALALHSFRDLVEYARVTELVPFSVMKALPPAGVRNIGASADATVSGPSRRTTTAAVRVSIPKPQTSERAQTHDDGGEEDPDDLRAVVSRLRRARAPEELIANICASQPASQRRGSKATAFSAAQVTRGGKPQSALEPPGHGDGYGYGYYQHTRTLYERYGPEAQRRSPVRGGGGSGGDDRAAAERRALLPLYRQDYGSTGPSGSLFATPSRQQRQQPPKRYGTSASHNSGSRNGNSAGDDRHRRSALARGLRSALERCGGVFRFSAWLWTATAARLRLSWGRVLGAAVCVLFWFGVGYGAYRGYRWVRGVVGALFGALGGN